MLSLSHKKDYCETNGIVSIFSLPAIRNSILDRIFRQAILLGGRDVEEEANDETRLGGLSIAIRSTKSWRNSCKPEAISAGEILRARAHPCT